MLQHRTQFTRSELVVRLITAILNLPASQPALIAVDGRSAAGKSTLADELAVGVRKTGRPALRSSLDDFHPAGHKGRSMNGWYTPASYYAEGYDYALFRAVMIDPLKAEGNRRCRLAAWDSFNDLPVREEWVDVPSQAVVIIDGIFLLRSDLRASWDYSIWLEIDDETMFKRVRSRDVAWIGSEDVVLEHYRRIWVPLHELYETDATPARWASVVVDNRDPDMPSIVRSRSAPGYESL